MPAQIKEQHERTLHRKLHPAEVQKALLQYVAAEHGIDLNRPDITGKVHIHRGHEDHGSASVTLTQDLSKRPQEKLERLLNLTLAKLGNEGAITIERGSTLHQLMEECAGMTGKEGSDDGQLEES